MTGNEIRERFLQFFESKGHRRVRSSSSLVPHGDLTLLFTNAGMNQRQRRFSWPENATTPAPRRHRNVRGGNNNDLKMSASPSATILFSEMPAIFRLGQMEKQMTPYFKREAIAYAWELLTCLMVW